MGGWVVGCGLAGLLINRLFVGLVGGIRWFGVNGFLVCLAQHFNLTLKGKFSPPL